MKLTIKKAIIVLFAIFSLFPTVSLLNSPKAEAAFDSRTTENCFTDKNSVGAQVQNSMVITCGDGALVYDPTRSKDNGAPTFISGTNDGSITAIIVKCPRSTTNGIGLQGRKSDGTILQSTQGETCIPLQDIDKFANDDGNTSSNKDNIRNGNLCRMSKTTDCTIWDGNSEIWDIASVASVHNGDAQGDFKLLNPGQHFTGPAPGKDYVDDPTKLKITGTSEANTCTNSAGTLGFIMCPILDGISTAIEFLIGNPSTPGGPEQQGLLITLLKVPPLKSCPANDLSPECRAGQVVQQVLNNLIIFANIFYILIFVVIIFANTLPLGIDNYTIKKTLPKLIIAIILTQFSFLICSIAVDIGNLLGYGVPTLLFNGISTIPGFQSCSNLNASDIGTALVAASIFFSGASAFLPLLATIGIIVIVVLFVMVLIAILIAFFWLMARYLIVYLLIFVTPVAFAAMVLPGTQKYFKMWAEDFVKVLLTFPLVTGMLAGSILISRLLTNVLAAQTSVCPTSHSGFSQFAYVLINGLSVPVAHAADPPGAAQVGILQIMIGLIPVIALIAIPKTLKWGGKISSAVGGAIGGYIGAKAGSAKNVAKQGAKAGSSQAREYGANYLEGRGSSGTAAILRGKFPGRKGRAEATRAYGAKIEEERKLTAGALETQGVPEVQQSAGRAMEGIVARPNDVRSIGEARAHIDKMVATGDAKGIAYAFTRYRDAARRANPSISDADIANTWNTRILSSNYGDVKTMSPNLIMDPSGRTVDSLSVAIDPTTNAAETVFSTGADYSKVGAAKITELDADILEGVNASVAGGTVKANDFHFDQHAVETALANPNAQWKSAKARTQMNNFAEHMYNLGDKKLPLIDATTGRPVLDAAGNQVMQGWTRPTPTASPPTPPSGPTPGGGAGLHVEPGAPLPGESFS